MEEFHNGNEGSFNSEEADNIVKESLVNKWTASIVERCLTQLVKQGKPYKYMVTCAVMQKTGAGLHTANSCYWDTTMDGKENVLQRELSQDIADMNHNPSEYLILIEKSRCY
ncbi:hypothetical protein F2P81_002695 [Scophthalmus maximus]|uniref:Dynein light chain Tctex-type 3 n=1 Tax=Scophthalmus maximus TaxID=52904 RepID=A0A6A4TF24_SCOMX|nr:hypothetical protein F2P81_002695 [Scophthalmus maximus]